MNKIIKITILSIFVVALSVAMVLLIQDKDNKYLNLLYYESELILEKEYDGKDVTSFDISTDSSDVIMNKTDGDAIKIKIYGNKQDEIVTYIKDNNLYITNDSKINICLFFCIMNSKIEISVPKEEYDNLKINIVSGDINLDTLKFNNIEASSKSGDITFDNAVNANIDLVSGNINFKELDVANLVTVSGNISENVVNEITAKQKYGE